MKLTRGDLDIALDRLKLMKFFPSDPGAQAALQELLAHICPNREALEWLTFTLINRVPEWPGAQAVRGLLCTKYDAADGIDAVCDIPGYRPQDYEAKALDAHQQVKAEGWLETRDELVKRLAAEHDMKQIEEGKTA